MAGRLPISVGLIPMETTVIPVKLDVVLPSSEVLGQAESGEYVLV
jgi:hypothetical protein